MLAQLLVIPIILIAGNPPPDTAGTIAGVVINGSRADEPIADVDVQLRAGANGTFEPVDSTKTDFYGKFAFHGVPLDPTIVYLPGTNRDGVHYPGQRVQIDPNNRVAHVKVVAFDAVHEDSPLTASRHDIDISVEQRVMKVTETLLVSNRSRTTFVGQSQGDRGPVTLRLTIPENFDRVTFKREFYGRRFRIIDHRLVTDLPWPPGERELQFTYRIPLEGRDAGRFRRPLDVPSSNVRIRVRADDSRQVSCNLSPPAVLGRQVIFTAVDHFLPAGYTIELQIGSLPIPWMLSARWASLVALVTLVLGTLCMSHHRRVSSTKPGKQAARQAQPSRRRRSAPQRAA